MSVFQEKIAFFQPGYKDTSIKKTYWVVHEPISAIRPGSTIEFSVPGTSSHMVDLSKSRLFVRGRILKKDGSVVPTTVKIFPVNLTLHSIFRSSELLLNQKNVSSGVSVNAPYKAYFDALLNSGQDLIPLLWNLSFISKTVLRWTPPNRRRRATPALP